MVWVSADTNLPSYRFMHRTADRLQIVFGVLILQKQALPETPQKPTSEKQQFLVNFI